MINVYTAIVRKSACDFFEESVVLALKAAPISTQA